MKYRLRSLRTPQNFFDRMKNCIERVKLSSGFAVMVFVFPGSVFTARYLRLNKGTRPDWKVRNLHAGYFRQLFFTLILCAKACDVLTPKAYLRACLYDPAKAGRDVFISPRRETRLGRMACLYGQKHCRDEAI